MKTLLSIILLFVCLSLSAEQLEVRVQSIECCYDVPEGQACCTLRLHVQLPAGAAFVSSPHGDEAASPLVGVDAEGGVMIGQFRTVESCMERCRTLVYDFFVRPRGGWIEFDTFVNILYSTSALRVNTEAFDPRQSGTLRVFNHTFFVKPLPAVEEMPRAALFCLEYEISPLIASISVGVEDGSSCHCRLIEGTYSEEADMTRATYLLNPVPAKKTVLQLSFFYPPTLHTIPVRFRIHPGLVSEPPTTG